MLVLLLAALLGTDRPPAPQRVGRLEHPPIREASGIARSRRHPGIFWVHNDSGNPPALFAVRRDGRLVREYRVAVPNLDWEDIAADDAGHLFLGDIGNNGGRLPVRAIYRLDEPDPARPAAGPLPVTLATFYRFAPGDRFDAEGLFLDGDRAVVVAKYHDGRPAALFAVPLDPPAPLLRPALPRPLATLPDFTEPATGASLSDDGRLLAVCSYAVTRVYRRDGDGWRRVGLVRYPPAEVEAVCWDGPDLILASEGRDLYRLAAARWRE